MKVKTMTQMWTLLDAYTLDSGGRERSVNNLNEWGGFSRRLGMPVFTAWVDGVKFDKGTKVSTCVVNNLEWAKGNPSGVNNQERWIDFAEKSEGGMAACFVIHPVDPSADRVRIAEIESERVIVGKIVRDGAKTYIVGQPRPL